MNVENKALAALDSLIIRFVEDQEIEKIKLAIEALSAVSQSATSV